jgi:cyclopropane-fatty-acyl-phospholipid synthase
MGSTQKQVEVSYDVDNEFFRLWLDERMNYTCALFPEDVVATRTKQGERPAGNLEQAQLAKLAWLSDAAHVTQESTVLDIGCGWGANLEFLALHRHAKACYGITLSTAQATEIKRRAIPNVHADVVSYADYKPAVKFDSIISICMMEHICSPEEARAGKSIDMYRNYFRLAHQWTKPGAYFGLQTILRNRVPRIPQDLKDIGWVTYEIFPGGITPRLEEIIAAVNPYFEVLECKSRRLHYERTCEHWRQRMRDHKDVVVAKWGQKLFDDYDRYLSTCIRGFEMHYQSLAQYSLRRIDS